MDFKSLFKKALKPTKDSWFSKAMHLFDRSSIDESIWTELEEVLIAADVGMETTEKLIETTKKRVKEERLQDGAQGIALFSGFACIPRERMRRSVQTTRRGKRALRCIVRSYTETPLATLTSSGLEPSSPSKYVTTSPTFTRGSGPISTIV